MDCNLDEFRCKNQIYLRVNKQIMTIENRLHTKYKNQLQTKSKSQANKACNIHKIPTETLNDKTKLIELFDENAFVFYQVFDLVYPKIH